VKFKPNAESSLAKLCRGAKLVLRVQGQSCLSAVPKQSVRCPQCWGYFVTTNELIKEVQHLEPQDENQ
jgi:hypothetical protein